MISEEGASSEVVESSIVKLHIPIAWALLLRNLFFYDRHALPMLLLYMDNMCASRVGAVTSLEE